jgi:hypothetical protein
LVGYLFHFFLSPTLLIPDGSLSTSAFWARAEN